MSAVIEITTATVEQPKMTDREIWDQQDFVDNTVHSLIEELLGRKMEWDIHITGDVRDAIIRALEFHGLTTEDELYPYVPEEEHMMSDDRPASFDGFIEEITENPGKTVIQFGAVVVIFLFILFGIPMLAGLLDY